MNTENLIIRKFNMGDLEDFILLIQDKMNSAYKDYDEPFPTDKKDIES